MFILIVLVMVSVTMVAEGVVSGRHERLLRARGAVEPGQDPYRIMRFAYPGCFLAMAVEGTLAGPGSDAAIAIGLGLWALSKALKWWAMASLGVRWNFRVLVLPGEPLVDGGPYRYLRHPNYVAVCGELIGVAIALAAPATGTVALVGFGGLMLRRIRIEERALGLRPGE